MNWEAEKKTRTQAVEAEAVEGATKVFLARTKSFTRRGRGMSAALSDSLAKVAPTFIVDVPRGAGKTTVAENYRLNVEEIFGRNAPLYVEIGPGRGEQVVSFAKKHPEINFLVLEVWQPGLARLVTSAAESGLSNLRAIEADAQVALPVLLPSASIRELWTFFPDPWRKARHHKRRLVEPGFAATVADLLEDGGIWRLATDWENYAEQMLEVLHESTELENPYTGEDGMPDFAPRFTGRMLTHFETRGREAGRESRDLVAVRLPRIS